MEGCHPERPEGIHISETEWYREARKSRAEWRALCQHGMANYCGSAVAEASLGVCEVECVQRLA